MIKYLFCICHTLLVAFRCGLELRHAWEHVRKHVGAFRRKRMRIEEVNSSEGQQINRSVSVRKPVGFLAGHPCISFEDFLDWAMYFCVVIWLDMCCSCLVTPK
jgi:hypothetical protein